MQQSHPPPGWAANRGAATELTDCQAKEGQEHKNAVRNFTWTCNGIGKQGGVA